MQEKDCNINEITLPLYLKKDIEAWINKTDADKDIWDCLWCELYGSINSAQHGFEISENEAWYLRKKYLGIDKNNL